MQNLERKELFREFAIDMSKNFPKGKMQFVDRARALKKILKAKYVAIVHRDRQESN